MGNSLLPWSNPMKHTIVRTSYRVVINAYDIVKDVQASHRSMYISGTTEDEGQNSMCYSGGIEEPHQHQYVSGLDGNRLGQIGERSMNVGIQRGWNPFCLLLSFPEPDDTPLPLWA